jgi:hypothetical protein
LEEGTEHKIALKLGARQNIAAVDMVLHLKNYLLNFGFGRVKKLVEERGRLEYKAS